MPGTGRTNEFPWTRVLVDLRCWASWILEMRGGKFSMRKNWVYKEPSFNEQKRAKKLHV